MKGTPIDTTIVQRFIAIARDSPGRTAVKFRDGHVWKEIPYSKLVKEAQITANFLHTVGIQLGDAVILPSVRSPFLCSAMLGILWAGGHYVFIDPNYPAERQKFICEEVGAKIGLFENEGTTLNSLDVNWYKIPLETTHERLPPVPSDKEMAACVFFTSGSTGLPKGVIVPHRGIIRLVVGSNYLSFSEHEVFLQLSALSFDASTLEIWGALLNGGTCVLHFENLAITTAAIKESIESQGVTTVWLTSALFNMIISEHPEVLKSVKQLLTGGEALSLSHIKKALTLLPDTKLFNGYGPTENTTFTTVYPIPRQLAKDVKRIPIGHPIRGTTCEIFDENLNPVTEKGQTGELVAFGDGLAIGYLKRPELTAEKFVEVTCSDGVKRKGYRTGDVVVQNEDGSYDFLQRNDKQVKIRGFRIELGEIESVLRQAPGVTDAVVVARDDGDREKILAAYFTSGCGDVEPSVASLRSYLVGRLPEYMVPSRFVLLDRIPIAITGKVDHQALPAPGRLRPGLGRPVVAPRTPVESWVASHWEELLNLEGIGVNDPFFELGGTSLKAVRLLRRLSHDTGRSLPTLLLFRAPTIADMARILEQEHREALPASLIGEVSPALNSNSHQEVAMRSAMERDELRDRRLRRRRGN